MSYIEEYLFENRTISQKLLSFLFMPVTFLYCLVVLLKKLKSKKEFEIPIISVGNIVVGGSGKTPFTIALCDYFKDRKIAVISRGYKRESKGLQVVSEFGRVLCDVKVSGDEAQEIAISTKATVIVSIDREEAILKAKSMGSEFIILDDGWNKNFEKFDILIKKEIANRFCLPSGGYRDFKSSYKKANLVVEEGKDFKRIIEIPKVKDFVLVSAISNPERLFEFVDTKKYKFFLDHYNFREKDIKEIKKEFGENITILTTMKDYVKLQKFNVNLEIIKLKFDIRQEVFDKIEEYLVKYEIKNKERIYG